MEQSIKTIIETKLSELKDKPDEYFLSPEFWVFVYETCRTYNNWKLLHAIQKGTEKIAGNIATELVRGFETSWKLPNNPDPRLPSRSLARTNPTQFDLIKKSLKRDGEESHCWACGISIDECKNLPANTQHIGLSAHEWWDWDEANFMRKLVAVRFLCFDCHYLTGRDAIWTLKFGKLAEKDISRIKRFCRVNSCTVPQMWAQMQHAREKWQRLNKTDISQWSLDLSIIDTLINE